MAATKRQMNWTGVGFTPVSGTLTTCTGVTQVQFNIGGSLVKFSGDGDRFPTTVVNDFNDPSMQVTTADLNWLLSIPPGTRGTATATHKDAKGATGGNMVYTLANAICENPQVGGQHRQIGSGSTTFYAESSDGTTNPLSYALS
ncbi:hypothetical protein [Singulisphaera sp. PoT]|uniref:hypothetical protein n=1 Tax=Singulisphaera sp. PoT TaxID=3411797 RepID=UPI003BF5076C